ncbi:MAG TPA: DNA ligase D [Stellaceae bacterium]|jgi:bifunctional non-homologous end joining protein LigD|nr:DNA ligase D [Stellaceae bacterium]
MAPTRKKTARKKKTAKQNLARYRAKRKFDITTEPSGGDPTVGGNSFVVQKHAARRLHYDFRLELDGVLLSWAIPRGPSIDPADKRLAAHVEDHPADYGGFEGTIPQGQYGGGTVMLWDRGTWEPQAGEDAREGYRKGRLKFVLHGERMKGGWTLVRMGPRGQERNSDNWLLIKERDSEAQPGEGTLLVDKGTKSIASGRTMEQIADAPDRNVWHSNRADAAEEKPKSKAATKHPTATKAAGSARASGVKRGPLPDFVPPTLATLVDTPPGGDQWLHEIKIDGYRIFARRRKGKVALLTRNALDWTGRFQPIADAIAKLPGGDLALDGEVAVLDQNGGSSFAALQDALSHGETKSMRYIVFDLLYRDGEDWRGAKLTERKEELRDLLKNTRGPLVFSDHVMAHGGEVFQQACNLSLEGVISKRANVAYYEGRTRDWLKTKCTLRQEFVIAGYVDSNAHRGIGALALGYYEDETLRYAGRVGTGFDHRVALDLAKKLKPMIIDRVPFKDLPSVARRGVHWVEPELVCEIAFLNWTPDGVLRHPSFQGLREDKPAKSVKRERAVPTGSAVKASSDDAPPAEPAKRTSAARKGLEKIEGVAISHPDRVIFPDLGITKRQLVEYYAGVAEWILPHIANRPLSLLRCPGGIAGECFFQKHFATGMKDIKRVKIKEKSATSEYLVVRDAHDLVLLIQEGVIEIHPWGATADDPDAPDQFIFDFDPAPDLPFTAVVDAAKTMRDYLAAMKIESFCKTTGGKGLHVVTPLKRDVDWAELKAFTKKIASNFATAAPDRFTINPLKRERSERIFLDYLRNDRGSTAVAPYVVRARPGATISLPLDWDDVNARLDPSRYTLASVPKLLAKRKNDPWAGMTKHRQTIAAAQRALGLAA